MKRGFAAESGLVAVAGGLSAGGLVLAAGSGPLERWLLLALVPLPILMVGLSTGWRMCLASGVFAALLVLFRDGTEPGVAMMIGGVAPSVVLVREALRPIVQVGGKPIWRSGGALLLWLTGLGIAGVIGQVAYFGLFADGLTARIGDWLGLAPFASSMAVRIAPGLAAAAWLSVFVIDGLVSGWMLARFDRALRPPVEIRRVTLPSWTGPVLMILGVAGALVRSGVMGIICLNSAIILLMPFAFLGLATIHALAAERPAGLSWVVGLYIALLASPALLGWRGLLIFVLMLAGFGSADQLMDFRDLRGLRAGMRRK